MGMALAKHQTCRHPTHRSKMMSKDRTTDRKSDVIELRDEQLDIVSGGLISEFNEAQTLASSVLKKRDDAGNAVIQKI
jgi:hypothetical protein